VQGSRSICDIAAMVRTPSSWPPAWSGFDRCIAIGKRDANDDVLFAAGADEVAVVHLTWARRPERPSWPSTTSYASIDEFLEAVREGQ
jgi:hypothetical protein